MIVMSFVGLGVIVLACAIHISHRHQPDDVEQDTDFEMKIW